METAALQRLTIALIKNNDSDSGTTIVAVVFGGGVLLRVLTNNAYTALYADYGQSGTFGDSAGKALWPSRGRGILCPSETHRLRLTPQTDSFFGGGRKASIECQGELNELSSFLAADFRVLSFPECCFSPFVG